MGKFDIFDTIDSLRKTGQPFCVATVVRTADVTSAKAGAKAAITQGGEILGHLGGGCVQRAVRTAVAEAIRSGETQMIRVKPSDKVVALHDEDGAQLFKSGCPSGGTVDLLIEPYSLPPMVAIFGATPIGRAIAAHALLAGYRVAVPSGSGFSGATAEFDPVDFAALPLSADDFVVVASQGANDLASLRAALQSPARRVSMVASRRKAATLIGKLAAEGMEPALTSRLKSPAGLDLGGIDPQDIALSVMAEIALWKNTDRKQQGTPHENLA